ncbi:capping protein inhibiting regulator of actin dynamics-like [Acropora muricata]|uniref:nucleolar protein 58-like n=1 Tax=Acropora millepora TaxID=45264 RepID=UPI001CF4980A|nr:nucleolar protein 58-like [Acropora millepora]
MKKWREENIKNKKEEEKNHYELSRDCNIASKAMTRAAHETQDQKESKTTTKKQKQEKTHAAEERREKIRLQTRKRLKRFREKHREEMRQNPAGNIKDDGRPATSAFKN